MIAVVLGWRLGFPVGLALFLLLDLLISGSAAQRKDHR